VPEIFMRRSVQLLFFAAMAMAIAPAALASSAQAQAPTLGGTSQQGADEAGVVAVPKPCAVLMAHVGTTDDSVRHNLYVEVDTGRIQDALNFCDPGEMVVLEPQGDKDAFLAGPLILPRGVTLYLDAGVVLVASRDPRDYDITASSCGAIKTDAVQCKPFIFSYQAAYSAVMGTGTIDGQGGIFPTFWDLSWWQRQQAAKKKKEVVSAPDLVSAYESQGFKVIGVTLRHAAGAHLSIYKTIDFSASDITIDSPKNSYAGPGIVLSNSIGAKIDRAWIQGPSEAIRLEASILGETAHARLHDLHIYGGRGIAIGDAHYGDVNDVEINGAVFDGADAGLALQLGGADEKQLHDVRFQNICMNDVKDPMQAFDAKGQNIAAIPDGNAVQFENVSVAGKGVLGEDGLQRGHTANCADFKPFKDATTAQFAEFPLRVAEPGTRTSLLVAQDGSGDFRTVQSAVDALPENGGVVTIRPGVYREVVTIRKAHVLLRGESNDPSMTTIIYGNSSPKTGGTFNSATVFVEADNVTLDHLTISNDFASTGGHGQAVALAVTGDRDSFRWLRLHGNQDTLFASSKYCYGDYGPCVAARQYFANCFIEGNIDFIFGDSVAVFENCELHGTDQGNVMFTAQSKHYAEEQSGYVFDHCTLTAAPRSDGIVALGRPWRPHASVVYLHTEIDAKVIPAGWEEWERFGAPSLPVAFYAEFDSTGPGADPTAREMYSHQLTAAEAEKFSPAVVLAGKDGWNPAGQ
jgi:polygalacturonase